MAYKGIRLGHAWESGKVLRYGGPSNLITIAPARMGKSRDVLMPFQLDYPYSVVVIDPKGEFAAVTSKRRAQFGEVIYLDPYGLLAKLNVKGAASSYNPMARLQPGSLELSVQSEKLSDALIWEEGGQAYNHFTAGARSLVSMIQMGLVEHGKPHQKNLIAMRDVITGEFENGIDTFGFAESIIANSTNQALRQKAAKFTIPGAKESRSLADIISTADVQTNFLSDPALARSVSTSDFCFADFKKRVLTAYVVLPIDLLEVCGKFFRLCVGACLSELLSCEKGVGTVVIIDEAFQIGALKSVENGMSMSAGFGVQLWPIFQDLSQLSGLYPQTWETFLANAGVRMFFTPRDQKTSEYLSSLCGQAEHRAISKSVGMQDAVEQREQAGLFSRLFSRNPPAPNVQSVNLSFSSAARPLVLPHEARELPLDEMYLFVENVRGVIRARRRPYWEEPDLRGTFSKNPYFK
jgi:type IV secretion system protein VirD4